jgi:anti-anti-sigma regulatory factor
MGVEVQADGIILQGRCAVEDAETLLAAIQDNPKHIVDLSAVTKLHTAVLQILLAVAPPLRGKPKDRFLREVLCLEADSE